ncbi:MAG: hypothetical protein ACE5JK_08310, partial [Candidatus Omnitrophota bacterium]
MRLVKEKDALWIPITDVNNVYMEISRSLWKIIKPKPLRFEINEWDEEVRELLKTHDPGIFRRIERCISWDWQRMDPDYLFAGRSMWLKLKKPIRINNDVFRYVKLKCTTYKGVFPPSSEEYIYGPSLSWIADEEGRIKLVGSKCILGAMLPEGAKNEFDIMKPALENDVSRALRVAHGVYPDVQLDGKRGHFVAMLVPEAPEITLEQMIFDHLPEIREAEGINEDLLEVIERVRNFVLNHGVQVRRGNDKGYFLKWPHQNNCLLFDGEQGPEQRIKDLEATKIIDRAANPNKMIACRFIDVFQAIQHYKGFFEKYPALSSLIEQAGLDPIRVFLEGYFQDRKEDPRIEVLYEAFSAEDPYRPPMSKPVAEADHPAIDLLKEVEYTNPRIHLLEERIKKETGTKGVVKFKLMRDSKITDLVAERMLDAIQDGNVVAFDLRNFSDSDERYDRIRELFGLLAGSFKKAVTSDGRFGVLQQFEFTVYELLKNAFVHGNKLDFDLPVFIH